MRRHKTFAFATSGLAAAIVLLVVFLTVGQPPRVSAATILQQLAVSLSRSVAIQIENVDFGNVRLDGEILVDRDSRAPGEVRYAEVHPVLQADNPEWNDLEAALVLCETPETTWQYCRGNGGSGTGTTRVRPTDYLAKGHGWQHFAEKPLDGFGSMPLGLSFSQGASTVHYTFLNEQRRATEALLHLLLKLSDGGNAAALVRDLEASAGTVTVEPAGNNTFILRASGFSRLGDFVLAPPVVPNVEHLVRQTEWKITYNPQTGTTSGWHLDTPPGLSNTGVGLAVAKVEADLPFSDPEQLIAYLEERAVKVDVDRKSATRWIVNVTGYPFPTTTAGPDWLREYVEQLRTGLVLEVLYDAAAGRVQSAEFRGFTGPDSRVRLKTGTLAIDPARLSPDAWLTPQTLRD